MNTPRAIRWGGVVDEWLDQGIEVDVICSTGVGRAETNRQGLRVFPTHEGLLGRIRDETGAAPTVQNVSSRSWTSMSVKRLLGWGKRYLWRPLHWPDGECLWYSSALKKAKSLVKAHEYDLLVSVALPFTSNLIAYRLRPRVDVKWLVDIGDPFSIKPNGNINNYRLFQWLNHYVEKQVLKRADAVSVTTLATADLYKETFPDSVDKIQVIPPMVSWKPRFRGNTSNTGQKCMRFVFLGSLYGDIRNPQFLLDVFEQLIHQWPGLPLELHFYGKMFSVDAYFESLTDTVAKKVFCHGLVPPDEARKLVEQADVLVNIGNDTRHQLPSKVVEYAATGNLVVNFAPHAKDSSVEFFETYPRGISLIRKRHSPEEAATMLAQFIEISPSLDADVHTEWMRPYTVPVVSRNYLRLAGF